MRNCHLAIRAVVKSVSPVLGGEILTQPAEIGAVENNIFTAGKVRGLVSDEQDDGEETSRAQDSPTRRLMTEHFKKSCVKYLEEKKN